MLFLGSGPLTTFRSVPKDLRTAGIDHLREVRSSAGPSRSENIPGRPTKKLSASRRSSHDAITFSPPYSNGASQLVALPSDASSLRMAGGSQAQTPASDEEIDEKGWVRKKVQNVLKRSHGDLMGPKAWESGGSTSDLRKALGYFRVNMSGMSRYDQFQVLAFTGGDLLSMEERAKRKVITSTIVR
jgi:hypothetical protein